MTFPTRKALALLAYLAVPPGQVHTRTKLARLLWSEVAEDQARNSLRQCLFALRQALADAVPTCIIVGGDNVSINPKDVRVDVIEFERLVAESTPEAMAAATALCSGEFLQSVTLKEPAFDQWVQFHRTRLRELAVHALRDVLDLRIAHGELDAAVQIALRILGLDPVQESVHRALMSVYLRLGRPESAIRQYHACAAILDQHLRLEPASETQQLYRDLLARRPPESGANGGKRSKTVLVVEDDTITRTVLQGFLESAGYLVDVAEDGSDALTKLGEHSVDLVLADIDMPRLNGLKMLELVVRRGLAVPVVFLTGLGGHDVEIKGFELGAADFIRKPVRKDVLVHRIENVLRRGVRYTPVSGEDDGEA